MAYACAARRCLSGAVAHGGFPGSIRRPDAGPRLPRALDGGRPVYRGRTGFAGLVQAARAGRGLRIARAGRSAGSNPRRRAGAADRDRRGDHRARGAPLPARIDRRHGSGSCPTRGVGKPDRRVPHRTGAPQPTPDCAPDSRSGGRRRAGSGGRVRGHGHASGGHTAGAAAGRATADRCHSRAGGAVGGGGGAALHGDRCPGGDSRVRSDAAAGCADSAGWGHVVAGNDRTAPRRSFGAHDRGAGGRRAGGAGGDAAAVPVAARRPEARYATAAERVASRAHVRGRGVACG